VCGIFYYISVADFACTEWFQSSTSGEDEGRDADISDGSQGEKTYKHPCMLQQQQQKHRLRWSGGSSLHSRFHSLGTSTRHSVKRPPDRNSGWLMDKIDKILTSTPNSLQVCLFHFIFSALLCFPSLSFFTNVIVAVPPLPLTVYYCTSLMDHHYNLKVLTVV